MTSLHCPECNSLLRLAVAPSAGQKVKCPKCGGIFLPTAGNADRPQPARPAPPPRAASAPPPQTASAPPARAASVPPPRAANDDAPRARSSNPNRDDRDGDDAARARKPAPRRDRDDDDDAPRSRKPARRDRDDDDDDAPRSRKSASRRNDDDDDDRPSRSRRKQPKKSQGNGLLIGLAVGGGLFVLLVAGGIIWAISGSKPGKNVAVNPPANTGAGDNAAMVNPANPPAKTDPFATTSTQAPGDAVAQPVAPPPPPPSGPVATGNLSPDVQERMKRATAFIRVSVGGKVASGSGFLMKANGDTGYVVTNFHVVAGPDDDPPPPRQNNPAPGRPGFPGRPPRIGPPNFGRPGFGPPGFGPRPGPAAPTAPSAPSRVKPNVTVVLNSGTPEEQSVSADVVAVDDEADLAVVRITGVRGLPAAIDMAQEAPVAETMPVYIFGFPGGVRSIVIKPGSVSQIRRDQSNEINDLQINGEIIPGNSGGPVVDAQGRLVGIAVSTVVGKNVGFAIPTAQLNHMLRGCVRLSGVLSPRVAGNQLEMVGELWLFGGRSQVRDRDVIQVSLGTVDARAGGIPNDEFILMARLTDPLLRIKSAAMHYAAVSPGTTFPPAAQGWAPLANAQTVALKIDDQHASGTLKLPANAVRDQMYAFQVSYVNSDGQTVYTQPHQFRLTFPKNSKILTLDVTTPLDDPSRRYIEDQFPKQFPNMTVRWSRTPKGVRVEAEPVDNPQAFADKITFGRVTAVQGFTVSVVVDKVELPSPDPAQLAKDLADLKDPQRWRGAADRLAKVYKVLPDRQVEVAKALEGPLGSKDQFDRMAALNGLKMWAVPENVPALIRALGADEVFTRGGAAEVAGRLKDPAAAPALAKLLPSQGDRGAASSALKAIGPAAEKAVIPLATHTDIFTAAEACNILKEIGTAESVPVLKGIIDKKPNPFVGSAATNALKAIEGRKK